ncbi:MAG: hypothetical protein M1814_001237 [Vezdaea aestivalis]|nr:MAG: hypothetical protein M1814_001237 [Vezdaea aestivalis]
MMINRNHILRTHSYLFRIEVVQDLRGWSRKRPSESEEELVVEIYCLLFNRHKPDLPELYMVPELYMTEPMLGSHSSWEPQEAQNTWLQAQILEKTGQRQSEIPNMEYPEHLRLAREYRHYCEVNRQGDPTTGVLEFLLREAIQISPRMNQEYPQIELARAKHANEMAQQFSQLHRQHPTQSPTLLFLWMNIYLWLRRNFYLTGPPSDPVGHSNHLSMSSASNSDYYPATVASSTQPTSVSPGPNVSRESDAFPHADPMSMDSVPPERSVEDITDLVQRLESQANSSTTEGPAVASTSMKREPFDDSPEITLDSPVANEQKEILDYEMSLAGL